MKTTNPLEEKSNEIDYFEQLDSVPKDVVNTIFTYLCEDNTYETCSIALERIKPLGWTFEYGLDSEPFNLKPIKL